MAKHSYFTCFTILFLSFHLLILSSLAISHPLLPSFASTQKHLWSINVATNMPTAISSKLSPLNELDTHYYSQAISTTPNFQADDRFCNLAKLSCPTLGHTTSGWYYIPRVNNQIVPMKKVDPLAFFRLSILKQGNTVRLANLTDHLPNRAFLPPQIASKISLNAQTITEMFPLISKDSINTILSYCNAPDMKGETKACPKSLEEMLSFSKTTLGAERLLALTTESTEGSGSLLTIKKVRKIEGKKFVVCHEMLLPFAAYYCHSLSSSEMYSVELVESATGAHVNTAMAICHMDTSAWPANHVSLRMLNFGPGQGEACHWFGEVDLAFAADAADLIGDSWLLISFLCRVIIMLFISYAMLYLRISNDVVIV